MRKLTGKEQRKIKLKFLTEAKLTSFSQKIPSNRHERRAMEKLRRR